MPAHNEERTAGILLWKIRQVMIDFPRDYHILVLDDGSNDRTAEVLEPYSRVLPLEDKATGQFAGDVGFGWFRRDIVPLIDDMPEMGWVLAASFHGKGYATEAGRAALAWMDKAMPRTKTCALFHPENKGSIRVADKLGFTPWTIGQFKGEDTPIYMRPASRREQ
jgi:RimJ/RimL family protein N-acetyltransferase